MSGDVFSRVDRLQRTLQRSRRLQGQRAFTLIEMLVVIAILGVLSALGGAAWAKARNKAARALCAGNLHQIGIALAGYHGDHNGLLPQFVWTIVNGSDYLRDGSRNATKTNLGLLFPDYCADGRALHCPKSAAYNYAESGVWRFSGPHNQEPVAFSYVFRHDNRDMRDPKPALVADHFCLAAGGANSRREGRWNHADGYNTLFSDGSLRWLDDKHLDGVWSAMGSSNVETWYGRSNRAWLYLDGRP